MLYMNLHKKILRLCLQLKAYENTHLLRKRKRRNIPNGSITAAKPNLKMEGDKRPFTIMCRVTIPGNHAIRNVHVFSLNTFARNFVSALVIVANGLLGAVARLSATQSNVHVQWLKHTWSCMGQFEKCNSYKFRVAKKRPCSGVSWQDTM